MNRNLWILFSCQLIAVSSSIVIVMLGGIVGSGIAPTPALATLPVSLMIVGTALSTVPAAMLMKLIGRRLGFSLAALIGCAAALLASFALRNSSFLLFCIATAALGLNLAFVQQYRFAAAESVPLQQVGRAISLVLLGSIGGAMLGPELASRGQNWLDGHYYSGTLMSVAGLLFIAAVLLLFLSNELAERDANEQNQSARPLLTIIKQPVYLVAMMGGLVGYGVMTFVMTATPVSMHVIDGHSVSQTAGVIRSHVIAMYAPALFSGFLTEKLGSRRMMTAGACIMLLTVLVGLQGHEIMHYWLALVLLGVGWNFLYIGGTTLLTRTYRSRERFKAQAVNDFSVFAMSASGSLLAGTVIHYLGWTRLMIIVITPLLLILLALYLTRGRQPIRAKRSV
ncbi:MAG: MFS transporter [Gammaproteobacteria bacterium]|nr:MFS transporter [Gammaproteobacteria bacterium]